MIPTIITAWQKFWLDVYLMPYRKTINNNFVIEDRRNNVVYLSCRRAKK